MMNASQKVGFRKFMKYLFVILVTKSGVNKARSEKVAAFLNNAISQMLPSRHNE